MGLFFTYVYIDEWFLVVFGILLTLIGILEVTFVYINNFVEARERNYSAQVGVIRALSDADPEVRASFGAWFPEYNLMFTPEASWMWMKTDVPVSVFEEFMRESNEQYTVAQRNWKAKGNTYWGYWKRIYKELLICGLVLEASSSGSHSEMWVGNGYKRAFEMWMYNIPRTRME